MSSIKPEQRPTFKVAHLYRCNGLCERQTFLDFHERYTEAVSTIAGTTDECELWKYVRSLFDYDDYADCVPINAANLSIIFNPVQLFMNSLALNWNRDISIQKREAPFVYTIQVARELIAKELNVKPELLAFQRNGSDPNAVINNGMTFKEGEEVVVWNENHPTDGEIAWRIRKDRFPNINIVVVDLQGEQNPFNVIAKFVEKVNAKTKLVTFSEVSHLSGTRLPAKNLIAAIHAKNSKVHVHLDGAQSWGAFEHDLVDIDCDSYCGGSHKWFLGPKETGILYMKEECIPNFAPKDIGYNGKMHSPPDLSKGEVIPLDASRFEMIGQRNDTNLIGLLYGADLMGLIGFDKIGSRIKALTVRLRCNLEKLQEDLKEEQGEEVFIIETPSDLTMFHGILVIKFPEEESCKKKRRHKKHKGTNTEVKSPPLSVQLYDLLYDNYKIGVSTKKGNRMRFSPHIYNTEEHMDRVVDAMRVELGKLLGDD